VSGCATLGNVTDALAPRQEGDAARPFSGREVALLTGGRLLTDGPGPIMGAAVDSRQVVPGNLFVALPGERSDGHRHLSAAARAGATALLVRELLADQVLPDDVAVIAVDDTLGALQALAEEWRSRFNPLVVGVTGSIAKTSTKDAVAAVLGSRWNTLKSEGNQNNEIGLPLTLLRLGPEHGAVVLEMGMYVEGEIAFLAQISRPRIGVVTAVHPVHLARIGTLDAIERAKGELVQALPPDGTAVLNADDERVRRMAARTAARTLTYGFDRAAQVRAADVRSAGARGMEFELFSPGFRAHATIPTLGRHAVHNALAAAAVGIAAGLSPEEIAAGLRRIPASPHRGELIAAGPVTLLDDSYNAAPRSVKAALDLLVSLPGRSVAVLGEMMELGEATDAANREVGEAAAQSVDLLLVVGAGAAPIADAAGAAGLPADRIVRVPDQASAARELRDRLRPGDVVLVKASHSVGLDLLVDRLRVDLADPGIAAGGAPADRP